MPQDACIGAMGSTQAEPDTGAQVAPCGRVVRPMGTVGAEGAVRKIMRANLNLTLGEETAIRLLAKKNHRTVPGEIAHVLLLHLEACGYVPKPVVETSGTGPASGDHVEPPPAPGDLVDGHPF